MSKEVQKRENAQSMQTAPANTLIAQAIEKGADISVLERLFDLQERWEKNQAKKEYDEAMTQFQAECPIIPKIKDGSRTKSGELAFKYAPLDYIVKIVKPILAKHQLSYDFKTVKDDAGATIAIRCFAKHIGGHSDYSEMDLGQGGGTSIMSDEQIKAAKTTFAKRYAFCNIFGIVTEDEDNEKALQNVPIVDVEGIKAKFDKCKTIPQVKKVRDSLTQDELRNVEIVKFANDVIKRIKEDIPVIPQ